ncbi:MAG TPA: hypothetical protein VFL85_01620 [Candidatus Saccharimonadales bacterium]|nr:hypothetical protein [Candidatus Saccharimonadales bacterium]
MAEQVIKAKKGGGDVLLPGIGLVATKSISAVEKTTSVYDDFTALPISTAPQYAPDYEYDGRTYDGGVVANWYKKNVDRREWDSYYSKSPAYRRLDAEDQSVWVAMRLPELGQRGTHLVPCNSDEVSRLDAA